MWDILMEFLRRRSCVNSVLSITKMDVKTFKVVKMDRLSKYRDFLLFLFRNLRFLNRKVKNLGWAKKPTLTVLKLGGGIMK